MYTNIMHLLPLNSSCVTFTQNQATQIMTRSRLVQALGDPPKAPPLKSSDS